MEEKREENQEESRQGSKESGEEKRLPGQDAYEWVQALVCSVLTVVMIFTFAVRLIGVDGHSMVPTLQHADRLVVLSPILYHDYKAGGIGAAEGSRSDAGFITVIAVDVIAGYRLLRR